MAETAELAGRSGGLAPVPSPLVPQVATIRRVVQETDSGDVRTFHVSFDRPEVAEAFRFLPGQCAMVSRVGAGESMISISSSPTRPDYLEFAIKNAGRHTNLIHQLGEGRKLGIRGPYGNHFPVESSRGKNLVIIGGGFALAPVRSFITYCLDHRDQYGRMDIIYGARSPGDLCFKYDLKETWPSQPDVYVHVTVDRGDEAWTGPVGFVPSFTEQLAPRPDNAVAVVCGPPAMIKFTLPVLERLGFGDDQIITTLEMKMQCGVGLCGRCNIGGQYVCQDGPVFSLAQLKRLPQEF
ncbi:MAG: FAD/NAD(P)-binding protein [Bacillota bacterium]